MTLYSSKTPRDLNENRRGKPSYSHFGMVRQHNAPNPILVAFREEVYSPDADMGNVSGWIAWLSSPRMRHDTFMTGAGTPPLCSCGWQGKNHTGPILADHQREARQHVDHARRVLQRLENLSTETENIS